MIKTIGPKRYSVKYIYSTLLKGLALVFARPSLQWAPSAGKQCAVAPILHLYKPGQKT